jgi:hypothetical protein
MRSTQQCFLTSGCSSPRWPLRGLLPSAGPPCRAVRDVPTYCQARFRALEVRSKPPVPSADGAREPRSRREEEVDARASSTTSNDEIGHDPHRPEGLRRHGSGFFVVAPRRWRNIAVVASSRIRTHGARNGSVLEGFDRASEIENPAGHSTSPASRRNPVRSAG